MIRKIFGKRATVPAQSKLAADDEVISLSMTDMGRYVAAMAARRGYPADAHQMIARRVAFLERRGLPGLRAFYHEVAAHAHEPYEARIFVKRPDGREGGHCPFSAGVLLQDHFDELTSAEDTNRKWVAAPSNPILLIPKIAEWLRPNGRLVTLWWAIDRETVGHTVIEGFRVSHSATPDAMMHAEHVGFSRFPEERLSPPPLTAGFVDKVELPAHALALIHRYLES